MVNGGSFDLKLNFDNKFKLKLFVWIEISERKYLNHEADTYFISLKVSSKIFNKTKIK